MPPVGQAVYSRSQPGGVPYDMPDMSQVPDLDGDFVHAYGFNHELPVVPSGEEARKPCVEPGEVPDHMRAVPQVPDLEFRALDEHDHKLQLVPLDAVSGAASAIQHQVRHNLPELPCLSYVADDQVYPYVQRLPHEPRGVHALRGLPSSEELRQQGRLHRMSYRARQKGP